MCDVEEGPSLATQPCHTLEPTIVSGNLETVYSTFSLRQMEHDHLKPLTCPGSTPWTWCLNKKCIVDPMNPVKALCSCDIRRNEGDWVTLGGDQNPATCQRGYWSGTAIPEGKSGLQYMLSQGKEYPTLFK
jgi:hypothetical protein